MSCQFTYKGIIYECTGEDKDFQMMNFEHAISAQDWITVQNRIKNQINCWDCLKVVHKAKKLSKKEVEEDRSKAYDYIDLEKKKENKNKFW